MIVSPQYPSNLKTRIAFVGEAPSTEEVEKGAPLVGPSGRIFNAMLRTANLDRSEFLITNVFNEKLPDNEVKHWCSTADEAKRGGWNDIPPIGSSGYLLPRYREHLDRLRNELLDTQPNMVVPLGGTALWAFTGDAGISSQRGTVSKATRLIPGLKLLPTYHPAFVMKKWQFFPVVVGDLVKAWDESAFREVRLPFRELLIEPSIEEIKAYIPRLMQSKLLSVDIETGWGQITNIGFAPDQYHAINIPFVDIRKPNKSYWERGDEIEAWRLVRQILNSPVPKLGQNFGAYDFFWLWDRYGIEVRNVMHDTRLMHHNLYPELPKDLEFMGSAYTKQGSWKNWGHKAQEKRDS